jgi:hypothetical protein
LCLAQERLTMMKTLLTSLLLLGCWQPAVATLRGIDVYGSSRTADHRIQAKVSDQLVALAAALDARDERLFASRKAAIIAEIKTMGDFAFVDVSIVQYFNPTPGEFATVDLVDRQDQKKRMTFLPAPTEKFPDPDGLLAAMEGYVGKGFALLRAGQITGQWEDCGAWHCLFGFRNAALAPYGAWFKAQVPVDEAALVEVLRHDATSAHRADAAFLLAHIADGQKLVDLLIPSIQDENSEVRNNILRVLQDIANHHPEIKIPLAPIVSALDFPGTLDRNKSAAVLAGLADQPGLRARIAREAGPILLRMLRLQQPNNHDWAYIVLKKISGETYGERDYNRWASWLHKHASS